MSYIGKGLENRITNTLKLNPHMTYMDAVFVVLRSEGIFETIPSLTRYAERQRSEKVNQRSVPTDQ